ncbi:transcription factor HIVEP3 [Monodelphis domestica]|uniref:transcription factor HIVEP3 n=1 Tax=Monodelphis domestica TaxID=13616 RepID=UPI0024E1A80E|nr:transcription factor HIVEP3 [Monodelphis domestica]XP_016278027.2 transcription factor HIVEP3 [Monodelphis domestica]
MDPEQSVKSAQTSEGSPRKRLPKGEAIQVSGPSTAPAPAPSLAPASAPSLAPALAPAPAPAPFQGSSTSSSATPLHELLSQPQHFTGPPLVLREGTQEKTGHQKPPKRSTIEGPPHIPQLPQHPLSPAFMSPGKPEHLLEGPTWQLVEPIRPGPSGSFVSPGLHSQSQLLPAHPTIIPPEELQSIPKVYIPRASHISMKQAEEPPKKEKKPQKPGKYICQYCSRPCAKPSVLQKHIRSHTGERPYPCIPCGFSFKTKSNLYKHRKSHAHRIKAGLASGIGAEMYPPGLEMERIGGEEFEEPTEGESTDSEEETGASSSHPGDLSPRQKHTLLASSLYGAGSHGPGHDRCSSSHSGASQSLEESPQFAEPLSSSEHSMSHKAEDTHTIKQKLALRLSERKKVMDEQAFLSPGSKGSTESGYFSRSESAEQQISPPNTNAKSYAEIIFGKCGRIGQRTAMLTAAGNQPLLPLSAEDKPSLGPISVPRTQVIEHITKLITINEAVVDTSEIDSVKPRRSSLSRRSSIESPKAGIFRDPFQLDPSKSLLSHSEKGKPEQSLLSLQQLPPSSTEPAPLLRSHSMPSATCTISSPHTFRGSYSFDDHISESDTLSRSQVFTSHPRTLKRQPAFELPLGGEYSSEDIGLGPKDTASKPAEEKEVKESELTKKSRKGSKAKGITFECNICGARYKKRDNYEAHKKYYCSELQLAKPASTGTHPSSEAEKNQGEPEPWSQMMHYKLGTGLELTPLRKRRKEKSLGDDEDTPSFESTKGHSSVGPGSQFTNPAPSEASLNLPQEPIKPPAEPAPSVPPLEGTMAFHSRTPKPAASSESGKERRKISTEISVIQHTSSFEKPDPPEQLSHQEGEDKALSQFPSQPAVTPHGRYPHSLQPRLVRQPNIQVPEILVTEEPDRPDTEPEPPPKEPEKTEEFQWPQRSQTLAQLPAEKLPPKKKRLRLAEMAQSSGESSFESVSLTRSPSLESSVSHASSHSASFEREDHGKTEAPGPSSETHSKSFGSHMLTVPSYPHHSREMRRSASEQSPNIPHPSQISETRSKSFDYGSLSLAPPPTPGIPTSSAPPERRKCFLVRQASLSRHPEHELPETEEPIPSSSKSCPKSLLHQPSSSSISSASTTSSASSTSSSSSHGGYLSGKSQQKDSPQLVPSPPYTEALQVFHPPIPQLSLHEKPYLPPPVSLFSFQHFLQQPGQSSELFSTPAMPEIFSAPYSMPPLPHSLFQTPPIPLQQAVLHPGQLHMPHQLIPHPTDLPFRQHPSFLPMPYPSSSSLSSGFFLPLQSQFALHLPGETGTHLPPVKSSLSPLTGPSGLSPSTEYGTDVRLHPATRAASPPVSTAVPQLAIPSCPDPAVSLVVPVRIQTHMPSYGSVMYTTLSQILVTQSQYSPSSLGLPKFDDYQAKGPLVCGVEAPGVGLELAQISEEQRRGFPTPYLRVPLAERKGSSLSSEGILGLEGSPSTAGGSKRVLSPAGSLELTTETQQQKRVKEEEGSKADEKLELLRPAGTILAGAEGGKRQERAQFGGPSHGRGEEETLPSSSLTQPHPKDSPPSQYSGLPHSGAPGLEASKQLPGKPSRRQSPLQAVKKEDSKDLPDHPPKTPPTSSSTSPRTAKSREGTDAKKVLQFPSLHTTTNVSWCYLNYIKPNPVQQADRRSSVYAGWCISLYNPNLPGVSTKAALSLLRSKQKISKEIYTMAMAPHPETGRLVPSSSRKPRMTEAHLPSMVSSEGRKDLARPEKEEDKRGKPEEEAPASKRGEPGRIKIFEGGYKSNEEYVYVRGRGRGKYVCEECGIRCRKPSMLKKHIRTHTDVRPYVCKHCHFAFKTKGNLTKHMKSKAHSKKCQEMGLLVELETEEGASDDPFQDSEGREGSEAVEEHQFSDLEESDEDEDNEDDEEEEEEEESQDEPTLKPSEGPLSAGHSKVSSPPAQDRSPRATPSLPQDVTSCDQPTASLRLEARWPADWSDATTCQSHLCLHQPVLMSQEPLAPTEQELGPNQQAGILAMGPLLSSQATSPRRPWSPGKEPCSSRPMVPRKHSLTKNESPPQRFAPTGDLLSFQCGSPGRGISPSPWMVSPLRCMSPSIHLSPRRELSPRAYLPPEGRVSPERNLSPSQEMIPIRHSSPKKMSPGLSESPPRYPLPGKDDLAFISGTTADEQTLGSIPVAQRGLFSQKPLPHKLLGKNVETSESKTKLEPRSPACSPGPAHPFPFRPFSSLHEFHGHPPGRTGENLFSHLPLHSQRLARTPCPMIPIGGIQMVQARPSSHPTLMPGAGGPWSSCFFGGGSDLTDSRQAQERSREGPPETSSASVSPVAKVSKFTLSSELESSSYSLERMRTSEGQGVPRWERPRPGGASSETKAPALTDSPGSEPAPRPSPGRPGQAKRPSPCTDSETPRTFPSAFPSQTLDRSSSTGCLMEPARCPGPRRRNLSGELRPSAGPRRRLGSPPLESEGPGPTPGRPEDGGGS